MSGDNGSGKRMLLYHLAKEWAENRIHCSFHLVYLILDTTLSSDLLKILQNNRDTSILLLVYGLSWKNADGCFQDILTKTESFSNVKIIFACDSKLNLPLQFDCYHVVGFSQIGRDNFIDSSFITPNDKCQWNMWIGDHPFASALCFRPLYCAMLLHIFKNRQLGDAITNFTSLYRLFLVSTVLQHVSYDINSLSDLSGKDKQDFEVILKFSQKYVEPDHHTCSPTVWDEHSKDFGLINTLASCSSSPFFHPTIALFMATLKNCTPNSYYNSYSRDRQSLFRSDLYHIFSLCLNTNHKHNVSPISIYQAFEIQDSPRSFEALIGPEMFDPLNWFMYGWCINNNHEQQLHIPQKPDQIRQLAIEMIHQSSLHQCSPYHTQEINGEAEMLECIKVRDQQPTMTGIVQRLSIAGNLGSALNDPTLNFLFPHVKILIIKCEKWIASFNSLTELIYLQDLTVDICPTFANSLPCDLPYTLKKLPSLRNLTLQESPSNFLATLFRIFSEDPTIKSLKSLCISGSRISNNSLFFLETIFNKESCLETLVFKNFSMDCSGFKLLIEYFLPSKLNKVELQGIGSIGDDGVTEIANVIETNLPAIGDKKLEVDDTSISGRAISRLIMVIARQDKETKKLSLFLPVKYKYDFHNIQNVFFIKQMPNLILENNLLLQPPSTSPPSMTSPPSTSPHSMTSPPSTSPPSMTSPPSTSPHSMTSPLTSPPLKRQSDEPLGENAPNPKRQQY